MHRETHPIIPTPNFSHLFPSKFPNVSHVSMAIFIHICILYIYIYVCIYIYMYIYIYVYIYIYPFHIRPMPSPSHHGRHLKGCRLRGRRLQQLQRQLPQPRPATFVFSPGQAELRDGDELQDEVTRSVPGWLMLWHMMAYKMAHWYSWSDGKPCFGAAIDIVFSTLMLMIWSGNMVFTSFWLLKWCWMTHTHHLLRIIPLEAMTFSTSGVWWRSDLGDVRM